MDNKALALFLLGLFLDQFRCISAGNGEPFSEKGQKSYEDDEEGKIIPHRYMDSILTICKIWNFRVA